MVDLRNKIASLSLLVTSVIIFVGVTFFAPFLVNASISHRWWAAVTTGLTSFGLYRLVALAFFSFFRRWQWLRKWLLGDSFLEGTWVGNWVHDGKRVFTIEYIRQDEGETIITGRQIGEDLKRQADWSSESVYVDQRRERLIYVYSCDVYSTKHQQNGIGFFRIIKPNKNAPPDMLDGYAVDMTDGKKDPNTEYKISDDIVGTDKAIEMAKKKFNV